ncbi:hypothetical protein [Breoghania sp. JC706]|uniref:hypothetical protein n=1 Tax=Breoghania sp. JC706 TaxID=3117732 RepID=UPI003009DD3F
MKKLASLSRIIWKFLSSVLFWFLLTLFIYLALLIENFSGIYFSETPFWDEFYNISSAFLTGGLVSFFFYFLVVAFPDRRKSLIVKTNLQKLYSDIKRDIAYQIVFASQKGGRKDLTAKHETIEKILTTAGFRELFVAGKQSDEGFYAFRNYMSDDVPEYKEIILSLQILSKQIEYILHNYPISDATSFEFFKRLEMILHRLAAKGPGYEEEKRLSQFIWDIFGGANCLDGPRDFDPVQRMIDGI